MEVDRNSGEVGIGSIEPDPQHIETAFQAASTVAANLAEAGDPSVMLFESASFRFGKMKRKSYFLTHDALGPCARIARVDVRSNGTVGVNFSFEGGYSSVGVFEANQPELKAAELEDRLSIAVQNGDYTRLSRTIREMEVGVESENVIRSRVGAILYQKKTTRIA